MKAIWRFHPIKLVALACICVCAFAWAVNGRDAAAPDAPAVFTGQLASGKKVVHKVLVRHGKQAHFLIVKGKREVVVDIYDPKHIAANEGVDDGDWFPVEPGWYTITVNNVSGLSAKQVGRTVVYEIVIEVR